MSTLPFGYIKGTIKVAYRLKFTHSSNVNTMAEIQGRKPAADKTNASERNSEES